MVVCRKCFTSLPDGVNACPVCGLSRANISKRTGRISKTLLYVLNILSFLVLFFDFIINITAGYYSTDYTNGILLAKLYAYNYCPALEVVDIIFYALYLISFALVDVAMHDLSKMRYRGLISLAIGNCACLFVTLSYPLLIYVLSGLMTPMIYATISISVIYTLLASVITIRTFKLNTFIY